MEYKQPSSSTSMYVSEEYKSPRGEVLAEALELVTKHRGQLYGPPTEDFDRTAMLWTTQFGALLKPGEAFEPHHVAEALICLKLSRSSRSPEHRDNWVDIAGYAACGHECAVHEAEMRKEGPQPG